MRLCHSFQFYRVIVCYNTPSAPPLCGVHGWFRAVQSASECNVMYVPCSHSQPSVQARGITNRQIASSVSCSVFTRIQVAYPIPPADARGNAPAKIRNTPVGRSCCKSPSISALTPDYGRRGCGQGSPATLSCPCPQTTNVVESGKHERALADNHPSLVTPPGPSRLARLLLTNPEALQWCCCAVQ